MIQLYERADIGACMDIKAHNGLLYAIQRDSQFRGGRLCVLRPDLSLVASYEGIGNARQIEIAGKVAVITAREDGIWLFDISAEIPRLLCHYRTVEYATGVALWANLACVSCRQYGVQILDISDPSKPLHLSLIRMGEVQSATVRDGILYGGIWGEMKVVIADIRVPSHPRRLTELPLQGRGDGVHIKDGVLYAATGQHAKGLLDPSDPNDPAFGRGNGVECFDVRDPSHPIPLNRTRFEKGYCPAIDMWEPAVYGDTLIVNNSILGVYGLDPKTLELRFRLMPPPLPEGTDAVTGVTSVDGDLFVATAYGGVFAYRGTGLGDQAPNPTAPPITARPQPFAWEGNGASLTVRYSGSFPVLELTEGETALALACGEGGVHLLDKTSLALLARVPTLGQAQDVKQFGNRLFVAEEAAGIEIFSRNGATAEKIGGYAAERPIYQLSVSQSGRYLMCACACNELNMLDISEPDHIRTLYSYRTEKGPLYGNNFAVNKEADGTMLLFCHRDGLIFSNPDRGDRQFHTVEYIKKKGFCGYCAGEGIETDGTRIFYTLGGGYVLLSHDHPNPSLIDSLPVYRAEHRFKGLLTVRGERMIAAQRSTGMIWILNIRDPDKPTIEARLTTNASPSKAILAGDRILLPGGRGGLLEVTMDGPFGKPAPSEPQKRTEPPFSL